jgi:hypothetical protein
VRIVDTVCLVGSERGVSISNLAFLVAALTFSHRAPRHKLAIGSKYTVL